jgi:hypothetical protein
MRVSEAVPGDQGSPRALHVGRRTRRSRFLGLSGVCLLRESYPAVQQGFELSGQSPQYMIPAVPTQKLCPVGLKIPPIAVA